MDCRTTQRQTKRSHWHPGIASSCPKHPCFFNCSFTCFRDKGIGRKLLQHACNLGLAKGCEKITLEASEKNTKLTEWYEAFGFVKTDSLSNYYVE
ncbi:MAG: GNAT family N-acetyltransferase [Prolixibacteraceae bacterium]|nr:GNAT family N-acetyltransferase [Prolixibacteraceae bacterium]